MVYKLSVCIYHDVIYQKHKGSFKIFFICTCNNSFSVIREQVISPVIKSSLIKNRNLECLIENRICLNQTYEMHYFKDEMLTQCPSTL